MNPDAQNTWPVISSHNFEAFVEATSRTGGIVAFFVALAGTTYLAVALLS